MDGWIGGWMGGWMPARLAQRKPQQPSYLEEAGEERRKRTQIYVIPAVGVGTVCVFTHVNGVLHGKKEALCTAVIVVGIAVALLATSATTTGEHKKTAYISMRPSVE